MNNYYKIKPRVAENLEVIVRVGIINNGDKIMAKVGDKRLCKYCKKQSTVNSTGKDGYQHKGFCRQVCLDRKKQGH